MKILVVNADLIARCLVQKILRVALNNVFVRSFEEVLCDC